jgi:hypothetical protein
VHGRKARARTAEDGEHGPVERHRHPGMMPDPGACC